MGLWLLNAPDDLADNSRSKTSLAQADYAIAKMALNIVDTTRQTPALGDFKGDDKRTLNSKIWYPEGPSSGHPLIPETGQQEDQRIQLSRL